MTTTTRPAATRPMSAPNVPPAPSLGCEETAPTSVKRRHFIPTWAQDEEAVDILSTHSWSSFPVLGHSILYNGPLPSPKLLRVASRHEDIIS